MAKCLNCKQIELTEQELKTPKQICMFCLIDYNAKIKETLNVEGPPIIPEMFGRTQEEFQKYIQVGISSYVPETTLTPKKSPTKEQLNQQASGSNTTMDAKEVMEMASLLNEFKKDILPITLDVVATEDFRLSYTFPGNVSEFTKEAVFKEMKKFYVDTARFILMSDKYGPYIKDPNEKPQNPMLGIGGQD